MKIHRARRGFVLVEAAALLAVATVTAALLIASAADSRRLAGLNLSEENLHRLGATTSSFTADHADLYWGFTWKAGDAFSQYPDLNFAPSDLEAHANQAADIIRRRADPAFPKQAGWISDVFYSDLVLADYLDEKLPIGFIASPSDAQLLGWQADPLSAPNVRLPYSSSYELPTSFYDKSDVNSRISCGGSHNTYVIPGDCVLGARATADVAFPSQKVHVYDRYQRHFGPRVGFLAYVEVRLPVLFADGSVDVRKTGDGNPGWQPNSPDNYASTYYVYQPSPWEPPTLGGGPGETVNGYLRWTRNGIAGRDYGGPEIGP